MPGKINSNICLMLNAMSVYKNYHQTFQYGRQRNNILQDLTALEIQISMKVSKTGFKQKPVANRFLITEIWFAKTLVLTSLIYTDSLLID